VRAPTHGKPGLLLPLLIAVALRPQDAGAQDPVAGLNSPHRWKREGGGSIGPVAYDIPHDGNSWLGAGQFAVRVGQLALFELAGSLFMADLSPDGVSPYGSFEIRGVGDVNQWRLSPILGVGAGVALADESLSRGFTLLGILGVRYRISPSLALRLDFQASSIDGGAGKVHSLTIGFRKRLR